ncbi:MAG: NUDIX hydrolase [Alphaproteobacteria bacterium]|nr:NUDIX hydrolase [Alphaproteobacteria bacterium]
MIKNHSSLLRNSSAEQDVAEIISGIIPFDDIESQHIKETLAWIQSGAPIFRLQKPDIPPKHLVSYFILFDEKAQKVLLVDHKKSQLWLPAGGHVEPGENPRETVIRECFEELGISAKFWCVDPLFLTSTLTVGYTAGHTDVSLWYVLQGTQDVLYEFDSGEFTSIQWFGFNDLPYETSDPHMRRFIQKLSSSAFI